MYQSPVALPSQLNYSSGKDEVEMEIAADYCDAGWRSRRGVNRSYQAGPPGVAAYGANTSEAVPALGQKMPQVVASPSCRVFMPVTNSGVQGLRMNPVQPHSPTQSVPVQPPVAPAAPPPTVQTVDTSNAPEGIVTLTFSLVFWSGIHCKSTYIPKIVSLPKVSYFCGIEGMV
ncbi:Hypothetical predicted protein [Olea europaea subsp. europaea]|uniref:Uncharacterized protein n=1 Tax=Olea europaea subsp. europaea TaxID=158383 RepID=A0A8S0PEX3_OLEEU|nr:Hypothetical predicted protein [Olea europaea subsp. europaea]